MALLWILAILTVPVCFTAVKGKLSWGMENEALIVRCPKREGTQSSVEWYHSNTNESIPTQEGSRVLASGSRLKFLPARVNDSGIYACIVRSPTSNKIGHVNVTIYKKPPDCTLPDHLMYSTVSGSEKNYRISCPTIGLYNWTATPLEWFKNCTALRGTRYRTHRSDLFINNVSREDEGDYTCKFLHSENGTMYNVTATRSFTVKVAQNFSMFPVITAPPHNDTRDVEVGRTVNITCSACFGKGAQLLAVVRWQVNKSNIKDVGDPRFQEEKVPDQSSSSELMCLKAVLTIKDLKDEDLAQVYDCVALNLQGVRRRAVRLRRKMPIDRRSIYYIVAGCSILLMLINILVIVLKVFWIEIALFWRDIARPYKTRNDGKLYDAYVIYPRSLKSSSEGSSAVECFVRQILPDVLESECGYRLCIYGRDLLPGEDAATAVESSIQKSRRHMFILTPELAHSKEFAYEQELALHNALIQSDSKVILIEMQSSGEPNRLQVKDLQDSLQYLVKVQGTIKWREDHVANKRSLNSKFWKHVRYQMPVPSKLPTVTSGVATLHAQGHWGLY